MVLYRCNRDAGWTFLYGDFAGPVFGCFGSARRVVARRVSFGPRRTPLSRTYPLTFWAYPCLSVACNEKAGYHAFYVTASVGGIYENNYIGAGAKASCGIAGIRLAPGADLGSRYPAAGFRRGMSPSVPASAKRLT